MALWIFIFIHPRKASTRYAVRLILIGYIILISHINILPQGLSHLVGAVITLLLLVRVPTAKRKHFIGCGSECSFRILSHSYRS